MLGEVVVVERERVGVLARVLAVEALAFGVGDEGFVGEAAFVGDDFVGVEEDGVVGSGNSLGWFRVATMIERVFAVADELDRLHNSLWSVKKGVMSDEGVLRLLRICSLEPITWTRAVKIESSHVRCAPLTFAWILEEAQ